jgi:histidine triad (HIT) family protein
MPSIFSRIISGEIPCYKIAEDENYLAFLDINPLVKGHTLVVPKLEVDYIFDLENELLAGLFVFSKKVATGMKKVLPCERIGLTVIGLEVPHAHVHLIPINGMEDMEFSNPKLKFEHTEFQATAELIVNALN